jgi:hypothetical protein
MDDLVGLRMDLPIRHWTPPFVATIHLRKRALCESCDVPPANTGLNPVSTNQGPELLSCRITVRNDIYLMRM